MRSELEEMLLLIRKQSENNDHRRMIAAYLKKHSSKESPMLLSSGRMTDVCNLKPDDIDLEDILSSICSMPRYASHTGYIQIGEVITPDGDKMVRNTYEKSVLTVGTHSLIMARILDQIEAPKEAVLWAAIHDFSEAYVTDVPRGLKNSAPLSGYREIEMDVMDTILGSLFHEIFGNKWADKAVSSLKASRGFALANAFDKEICLSLEMPIHMNRRRSFNKNFADVGILEIKGMVESMCYRCAIDFTDIPLNFDAINSATFLIDIQEMLLRDSSDASRAPLRDLFHATMLKLYSNILIDGVDL